MLCKFGLLGLFLSTLVKASAGLDGCGRRQMSSTMLTTELQSDVMLPCYFKPAFFRSDKAEDIAVVWSQINTAALNLLEIKMNGVVHHWVLKDREIRAFPKLSSSGNFSIILHKAQFSDEGLYRCELFKGVNCSVAYQELNLSVTKCRSEPLARMNITTQLLSDVLLPCYFKPAVLRSDRSADIAAVWSQRNTTTDNLLEIKLQGEVGFWKNRDGRIKTFPELSRSGNFSILLHEVQQSDLGLYHCELFRGIGCTLAYQDIYLSIAPETNGSMKYWHYLLGAAVALCLLFVAFCYMQWKRNKRDTNEEPVYENAMELSRALAEGAVQIQHKKTQPRSEK